MRRNPKVGVVMTMKHLNGRAAQSSRKDAHGMDGAVHGTPSNLNPGWARWAATERSRVWKGGVAPRPNKSAGGRGGAIAATLNPCPCAPYYGDAAATLQLAA